MNVLSATDLLTNKMVNFIFCAFHCSFKKVSPTGEELEIFVTLSTWLERRKLKSKKYALRFEK